MTKADTQIDLPTIILVIVLVEKLSTKTPVNSYFKGRGRPDLIQPFETLSLKQTKIERPASI